MGKKNLLKMYKRTMAILLTAAMIFSTFQGMSVSAYAAEIVDADVTEQQIEEVQDGEDETSPQDENIQEGTGEGEDTNLPTEDGGEDIGDTVEETPGAGEEGGEDAGDAGEETPGAGEDGGEDASDAGEETPGAGEEDGEDAGDAGEETPGAGEEDGEDIGDAEEETELTEEELGNVPLIEEVPAEGEGTELAYIGSEYADGEGLGIYAYEMSQQGMEFTDENLIAILNYRANQGKTYRYIQINYPTLADTVSKEVWNAALALTTDTSFFYISFDGMSEETPTADELWTIRYPKEASGDVILATDWSLNETAGTMTLSFSNLTVPADACHLSIAAFKNNVESVYASMKNVFGEGGSISVKDANGTEVGETSNSISVSDTDVEIEFYYVNELTAGVSYTVSCQEYEGELTSDGKRIYIYDWKMGNFSEEKLLAILNKYAGSNFAGIHIYYPYNPSAISQDVWNAVVAAAGEECDLAINFYNEFSQEWNIENPRETTEDVYLGVNWTVNEEEKNVSILFDNTTIPATSLNYYAFLSGSSGNNDDEYTQLINTFGKNCDLRVCRADEQYLGSANARAGIYEMDPTVNLYVHYVNELTADIPYLLRKGKYINGRMYAGTVQDDYLRIEASEISKNYDTFNNDILVDILSYHAPESYSMIDIIYDEVTDSIDAAVWNTAVALLAGDNPKLSFLFPGGTAPGENWVFTNPGTTDSDLNVALDMVINDAGEGMTFTFENTDFPADKVTLAPYSDKNKTEHERLLGAFYEGMSARIQDSNGLKPEGLEASYTRFEDDSARILLDVYAKEGEVEYQLTAGEAYTVVSVYAGTIWYEDGVAKGLDIIPEEVGKTSFTDEELANILEEHAGATFDEIYVQYPWNDEGNTISADALNSIIGYLSTSEETEQYAKIAFLNKSTGEHIEWRLLNPTGETSGTNVPAEAAVSVSDGDVFLNVDAASFAAERVDVWFSYRPNYSDYSTIKSILGEESIPLLVGEIEGAGYYRVGDEDISIQIAGASDLTIGTDYELREDKYLGTVTGEEGSQCLNLDYRDLEERGQEYSDTIFLEAMEEYEEGSFVAVHVTVPAGEEEYKNTVDKEIYNTALGLLQGENREGVYYNFNHEEKNVLWYFRDGNAIDKDLTFTYELYRDWYGAVVVKFDLPAKTDLKNASVSMALEFTKGGWEADMLTDALGEGTEDGIENVIYRLYPTGDVYIPVKWVDMGDSLKLAFMYNIGALDEAVTYAVVGNYPGEVHVNEKDGWRSLYISALTMGLESFDEGVLEEVLAPYLEDVEAGVLEPFNSVHVEQRYVEGKNTIRTEDYNLALRLLTGDNDAERNLGFGFCNCVRGEDDKRYDDDVIWNFDRPYEISKDINANATLTWASGQGVEVEFNSNTYAAGDVRVEYRVNEALPAAKNMADGLGQVDQEGRELVALQKGTTLDLKCRGYYKTESINDGEENLYCLEVQCVENYVAGTEYLLATYTEVSNEADENSFYIGDDATNSEKLKADRYNTKYIADEGSKKWISYNPDIMLISANGQVEALNSGEVYYALSYKVSTEKASTEPQLQIYKNVVDVYLKELLLDKTSLTMTLPREDEDWEAREYLRVKFYPSIATIDQRELIWEITEHSGTEEEPVIQLLTKEYEIYEYDENGEGHLVDVEQRNDGDIKALHPGTAVVTVTVPGREGEEAVTATCTITVKAQVEVPEGSWPDTYAVTNFDTTLEDVEFIMGEGAVGSWRWAYPDTNLANFKDMDGHDFPAIYTTETGDEITRNVWVRMVTLEGMHVVELTRNEDTDDLEYIMTPRTELADGENIVLAIDFAVRNGSFEEIREYVESGRLAVSWKASSKDVVLNTDSAEWGKGTCVFTADADKAGKKTITATLTDTVTKKNLSSVSHNVTVLKKPLADLHVILGNLEWNCENDKSNLVGEKGTLVINLPEAKYYKLTVKSLDTNILKIGSAKVDKTSVPGYVLTKIPYEIKAAGKVYLSITADDEVKSSISTEVRDIRDVTPKCTGETLTINKKWTEKVAYFELQLAEDTYIKASEVEVLGDAAADFSAIALTEDSIDGNVSGVAGILVKLDATINTGKQKIKIAVPVYSNREGEEGTVIPSYEVEVTVNVTDKVPSVTFKQTDKVNIFYTDEESYGTLTVTNDAGLQVQVELTDKLDKNDVATAVCNYELIPFDETDRAYGIALKDGVTPNTKNGKKGTLVYTIEGYEGIYKKDFTVSVEDKAPSVELSSKSSTIYPNFDNWYTEVSLTDKNTKEAIEIREAAWIKDAKNGIYEEIPEGDGVVNITMKSRFKAYYVGGTICFELQQGFGIAKAATDKISMQVKEENWRKPVAVTYSITTEIKEPKLELGSKSLSLNVNEAVYEHQLTRTTLSLTKSDVKIENIDVKFVGKDAASKAVLNNNLVLEYWGHSGEIIARFNAKNAEDRPKAGTYKFTVYADIHMGDTIKNLSTEITVKVVDKDVSKCVKVTAKGKIDVLDREGTYITYSPKLSDLTGEVVGAHLIGKDADMFETYWDFEKEQLIVKARMENVYSTKNTYKVIPVFEVQTEYWDWYEVDAKEQSVKVKQGKPKVTVSSASNVLYRDRDNALAISFDAVMNKTTDVAIADVRLISYPFDLGYKEQSWEEQVENENGEIIDTIEHTSHFNWETQTIVLTQHTVDQIVAKGKSWNLKFEVVYRDKAGNEKNKQVTYKVVIK